MSSDEYDIYDDYITMKETNPEYARLRWSDSAADRRKANKMEQEFRDKRRDLETYSHMATAACVIGFFVGGIILGPVAVMLGRKLTRMGRDAIGHIRAGWIITVIHFFITLAFIF